MRWFFQASNSTLPLFTSFHMGWWLHHSLHTWSAIPDFIASPLTMAFQCFSSLTFTCFSFIFAATTAWKWVHYIYIHFILFILIYFEETRNNPNHFHTTYNTDWSGIFVFYFIWSSWSLNRYVVMWGVTVITFISMT